MTDNKTVEEEFGASAEAIEFHYGTGNDYFSLWLGRTMAYSSALWDDNDPNQSLDAAQDAKIRHHCEQSSKASAGYRLWVGQCVIAAC